MSVDYSDAIVTGVFKFLEANKDTILKTIDEAIHAEVKLVVDQAVDLSATAIMVKVGKFLDENKENFITTAAAAIAASWQARQHPLPCRSSTEI